MATDAREREMRRRREEQRRRAQRMNGEKARRKTKRGKLAPLFMLGLLLVGALVVLSLTVLFPIKTIAVEGNIRYTTQQIIQASQVQPGDNLLRVSPARVTENVRRACPYVRAVTLSRKLPDRVIITVMEAGPALALYHDGEYVLVNADFEWIENSDRTQDGIVIYGVAVTPGESAKPVAFSDPLQKQALEQCMAALQTASVTQITRIDLTDLDHITMQYADRHIWQVGSLTNLDYKIRFGAQISQRETDSGTVDLSGLTTGRNGYFKSEVITALEPAVTPTDVSAAESVPESDS